MKNDDEPDATGRILLRPKVPFRSRRAALDAMAAVVRDSPPVSKPVDELLWVDDPPGQDRWQPPDETERRGTGDCEDIEMYAARADVDKGARDVELCMSVTPRAPEKRRGEVVRVTEHVFGKRGGTIVDHSAAAGMPPVSPSVYEQHVCVPVTTGGARAMIMSDGDEGSTAGPGDVLDDYNLYGPGHWKGQAWERAASQAAQRYPRARPLFQRVVPALKSAASYFSALSLSAWDKAVNDAKLKKIQDQVWASKRAEELARKVYKNAGGRDADFVIGFELRNGRSPTDRESVKAAIKALTYVATAKEHPGYRENLARVMRREPATLERAATQIAVIAQGLVNPSAFPVSPHCAECSSRRNRAMAKVVEPEDISLAAIYGDEPSAQPTLQAAPASPASPASVQVTLQTAPTSPAPMQAQPAPFVTVAPPSSGGFGAAMFGYNPFDGGFAGPAPQQGPFGGGMIGGTLNNPSRGPTSISNSGNVNLLLIGEGGEEVLGSGEEGATDPANAMDPAATMLGQGGLYSLMTSGPDHHEDEAAPLTSSGPAFDEDDGLFATSGPAFDSDEEGFLMTAGPDDEESAPLASSGPAYGDDEGWLVTAGPEDEEAAPLLSSGPAFEEDEGFLATAGPFSFEDDDGTVVTAGGSENLFEMGSEGEGLFISAEADLEAFFDPSDCETGACGLY